MNRPILFLSSVTLLFTLSAFVSAQNAPVQIELFHLEGCTTYMQAWNDVAVALTETGIDATVRLVPFATIEEADALHVPGSPTIKINGLDLEYYQGPGALGCRVYAENDGKGWPSMSLLTDQLFKAARVANTNML
ncbi:MAG: hypothetical protein JSV66_14785 [Trueperaceae bacterium]|nr:MAG: hypothetical protein JSV66_14785 [Trueperaceae bacterium]